MSYKPSTAHCPPSTILGIETSCDETAAAIVCSDGRILSNVIYSQTEHAAFGGVVPEIAARAHMKHLEHLIRDAMTQADCRWDDIDAVAVTGGPGLIGGVIVGVMMAKAIEPMTPPKMPVTMRAIIKNE